VHGDCVEYSRKGVPCAIKTGTETETLFIIVIINTIMRKSGCVNISLREWHGCVESQGVALAIVAFVRLDCGDWDVPGLANNDDELGTHEDTCPADNDPLCVLYTRTR
jgi:hypothetical protein